MDYRAIAKSHLPSGWKLSESRNRTTSLEKLLNDRFEGQLQIAGINFDNKSIYVPKLENPAALYAFFHELGHYITKSWKKTYPRHQREYQAEQIAHGMMRAYGVPCPRKMTADGKDYIRDCILSDEKVGIPIFAPARRYATS